MAVWRSDQLAGGFIDEAGNMAGRGRVLLCHRGRGFVLSVFLVYTRESMEEDKNGGL